MHPSRFKLETYRLGELSGSEKDQLEMHLQACDRCSAVIAQTDKHAAAFKESHDAAGASVNIIESAHQVRTAARRAWTLKLSVGFASAACVVVALLVFAPWRAAVDVPAHEPTNRLRLKGNLVVQTMVERGGRTVETDPDFVYSAGDRVYYAVRSPEDGYMTVFNGHGNVLIKSTQVSAGVERLLSGSVLIEGEPGDDEVVVTLSRAPREAMPSEGEKGVLNVIRLRLEWR